MSAPQDPEDEPVGDDLADAPGRASEDDLWRAIVDNYGERPEIDEPELVVPPSPRDLSPVAREQDDPDESSRGDLAEQEEHFVPPPPPPLPTPPPARLLAWVGLFGVPMFVLVALVAGVYVPTWAGLILMVWFVGGFVFLVASMRPGPGQDHDDGARL
jgi:hypothetical protein